MTIDEAKSIIHNRAVSLGLDFDPENIHCERVGDCDYVWLSKYNGENTLNYVELNNLSAIRVSNQELVMALGDNYCQSRVAGIYELKDPNSELKNLIK